VRYDSQEAPVLIRLPDISSTRVEAVLAATETHVQSKRSSSKSKHRRHSRESHESKTAESKTKVAIATKKPRVPSKLVVAGIIVGLSLGTLIFLNSGKKPEPAGEPDLWSSTDNVTATEPEVTLPGDEEPAEAYSNIEVQPRQGTQVVPPDRPTLEPPMVDLAPPDLVRQPLDEGNQPLRSHSTADGWPDEALADNPSAHPRGCLPISDVTEKVPGAPVDGWPPEIEIAGPRSESTPYEYSDEPDVGSPTYRQGMRPTGEPNSRVLNGTIETPTPRADYERTKTRLY
jgi:hypothetical protein